MLTIDTTTMAIKMTRGDEATIEFSAKEGTETYLPESGDVLTFGVAKKYGGDKTSPSGFYVTNKFDDCFEDASPTQTEFEADKTSYFTKSGTTYTRCTSSSVYAEGTQYYINTMWNIEIIPELTEEMKFGDYYWDLQLNDYTIIGKSDSLDPKFTLWGEVV